MELTGRYWGVATLAGLLAGSFFLLDQPAFLVGCVGICAWLLARQYAFVRAVRRVDTDLSVTQSVARTTIPTGGVEASIVANVSDPLPVSLEIEGRPPIAATGTTRADRTVPLPSGERRAGTNFDVEISVAGRYRFDTPRVTVRDRTGLFRAAVTTGPRPELTVEPNVSIDEASLARVYGEQRDERLGRGIELAEIRRYLPGDSAEHIDWKATARLNHPHIREFEGETDLDTMILFDHRQTMAVGPPGETKLDYGREVALELARIRYENNEPIGLYTVGDSGLTVEHRSRARSDQYATIRSVLHGLEPSADGGKPTATPARRTRTPGEARRAARRLHGDGSPFAEALRPFFGPSERYVERIESDPLYVTARSYLQRTSGSSRTVVITDDTNRSELREAIKVARRSGDAVFVCLTPSALYTADERDPETTRYERYVDYLGFRHDIASLDRVTVYEAGPERRLEELVELARNRQLRVSPQ